MGETANLRARAERSIGGLGALFARAERLAAAVQPGTHGRRRSGAGEEFWQYRLAQPGDTVQQIDWRQSARGDDTYIREREWQNPQTVMLWCDRAASMQYSSSPQREPKLDRARLLTLALAIMLVRAGERVGIAGSQIPPRQGPVQLDRIAAHLFEDEDAEFGAVDLSAVPDRAHVVMISDFLGPLEETLAMIAASANRAISGGLVQTLDPVEATYPFTGRRIFQSMAEGLSHQTLKADALREEYLGRLADRQAQLDAATRRSDWFFSQHMSDAPAQEALRLLWTKLSSRRKVGR